MKLSKEDIYRLIDLVREVGVQNRLSYPGWVLSGYDHFLYKDQLERVFESNKIEHMQRLGILKEITHNIYIVNFSNVKKFLLMLSESKKKESIPKKKEGKIERIDFKELVKYVAPEVIGKEAEKAAILLQLFSDLPEHRGLMRYRIHILLIGAPGTAKSALLYFIPKVVSNCKLIHPGTTEAGLRGSLRRDVYNKMGSLLEELNGGILLIDEFDKFKFDDIKDLLMAMEEGIVRIRGAEVELYFEARIRVTASANRFTFPQELLTRFDAIFYEKPYNIKELEEIADKMLDMMVYEEYTDLIKKGVIVIRQLMAIRKKFYPKIVDPDNVKEELKLIIKKEKETNIRWALQRWQRFAFAYARILGKNIDRSIVREIYELFKGKLYKPVSLNF